MMRVIKKKANIDARVVETWYNKIIKDKTLVERETISVFLSSWYYFTYPLLNNIYVVLFIKDRILLSL